MVSQITFKTNTTTRMTTARQFDFLNRLQAISSAPAASGALPFSYHYGYNTANQRTRRTDTDGAFWVYQYDALGQVISGKRFWSDGTPVAGQQFEYGFDDIGNRKTTKAGGDQTGSNLRSLTYTRNLLNQYPQREVPSGSTTDRFDVLGLADAAATVSVNGSSAGIYRRGQYFRKAVVADNSSAPVWSSVAVTTTGGGSPSGNVFVPKTPEDFDDPITQNINEGYDLDGNLLRDGRWNYTWDAENRLIQVVKRFPATDRASVPYPTETSPTVFEKVGYEYDWQGRRIAKRFYATAGGTTPFVTYRYLYDGWNLIAELDANNAVVRCYAWGLDLSGSEQGAGGVGGLLWMQPVSGGPQFAAFDGNGNVMGLVAGNDGSISAWYEYGPFGEAVRVAGTQGKANPVRFSTKYTDDETDWVYYGFRFYSPSLGRWVSRDPAEENAGANMYGLVGNEPMGQIDAFGLYGTDVHFYAMYYLLRTRCYEHDTAHQIASRSESVDHYPETEPVFTVPEIRARWHFYGSGPNKVTQRNPPDLAESLRGKLQSGDWLQAGLDLHVFADTWSHEGFTAWWSRLNKRTSNQSYRWVGHLDAAYGGHEPDLPFLHLGKTLEMSATVLALIPDRCGCNRPRTAEAMHDLSRGFSTRSDESESGLSARVTVWQAIIRMRFGNSVSYSW